MNVTVLGTSQLVAKTVICELYTYIVKCVCIVHWVYIVNRMICMLSGGETNSTTYISV